MSIKSQMEAAGLVKEIRQQIKSEQRMITELDAQLKPHRDRLKVLQRLEVEALVMSGRDPGLATPTLWDNVPEPTEREGENE